MFLVFVFEISAQTTSAKPGQLNTIKVQINKLSQELDRMETLLQSIHSNSKIASVEKRRDHLNILLSKINTDAEKAQEIAKKLENMADAIDKEARVLNCFSAATEADDGEDYCRHMTYFTKEIFIYATKAWNEADFNYSKSYISKLITYSNETYESIKNARLEFEDCLKDLNACEE